MDDHTHEPDTNEPDLAPSEPTQPEPASQAEPSPPPEPPATPRRPRRRRPNGRWSNPATPLQAARFERRISGQDVIKAIRRICPGHSGESCKIDVSKLSDYERGNRRPGLTHIEAFARLYNKSPEELSLIRWRDEPTSEGAAGTTDDPDATAHHGDRDPGRPQLVLVWVRDRLDSETAATAAQVLQALSRPTANDDAPEDNLGDTAEATD